MEAVFIASQNSPSLVVPSPAVTRTTSSPCALPASCAWSLSSSLYLTTASAAPTAWRNWVPVGLLWETMLSFLWPQWLGICRPPELGSSSAATADRSISFGVMPSWRQSARSR